ncbi:hypothetical protein HYE82_10550 [Streptomyces sp. BR123]|uniref:hypothetical protein n=1 Tax=Streptomyces sp. BR123 TaxID=2749828 RepID=UPI0015C49DFB|nr:hypothetical protein [Streptomyces sp. BR123]NXY94825.1 hypothetical protein [Streptomyces sp. BR123]
MGARVVSAVFRLVMAALILLLAVRTYEETAVALARSNGSLRTAEATVSKLTSHTESGRAGGGQDGGSGNWIVHTEYTVELRVGDELTTVDGVPDAAAHGLREGQRVTAGLWHGRVVEVDGRDVWPGWHAGGWDIPLFVLYPLVMGYLIALAVAACAHLACRDGRARLERQDRSGPWVLGFLVAVAAVFVLIVCAAFGNRPAFWPLVPVAAGTAAALARLRVVVRRIRSQ